MPVYTCTTTAATLDSAQKSALAHEITRIHAAINHVPSKYVNVVFHELPAENVYTDAAPASPLLLNGWARSGHSQADTTRLALEIADAAARVARVDRERVLVVIQHSPASSAVKGRRVLPEPGQEQAWMKERWIHPEKLGVFGVAHRYVACHAFGEAELTEQPEPGGQLLLTVLTLCVNRIKDRRLR